MGKFISNFETTAELTAFSATTEFKRPHVSLTKDDKKVHFFKDPCTSDKVKTSYEWVEIGGVKWATKNVGALTVTDYGQYFSWGGVNGFTASQVSGYCHSKAFSWADYEHGNGTSEPSATGVTKYNSTDGKTVLEASDDAATVNMGSGWRMPTKDEFKALGNAVTTAWTQVGGVYGMLCTDKTDSSKTLFFPACGSCYNGSVNNVGSHSYYLSSSLYSSNIIAAYGLYFYDERVYWVRDMYRQYGCAVRGVYVG